MRRLWVQLSLAMTLISLAGFLLIFAASIVVTQPSVLTSLVVGELESQGGLIDQLRDYYREHKTWKGVTSVLEPTIRNLNLFRDPDGGGLGIMLLDPSGVPFYETPVPTNTTAPSIEHLETIPVRIAERIVGYLLLNRIQVGENSEEIQPFLLRQISNFLLRLAMMSSIVSVITAIFASRSLTRSLGELARVAREFGKGNLSHRAKIAGSTEVTEVATAFNEMADSIQNAETLRRGMVADIAHELRTPLTVLQANLQAILDDVYPLSKSEIEGLSHQTDVLRRLVDDLHELAQLEAQKLPLELVSVDLNTLLQVISDKFRTVAESHQISLETYTFPTPLLVAADSNRLTQVINNLLQNAVAHTPAGGKIQLSLTFERDLAVVGVKDTGQGIAADALPHVFERFYRVDRSRNRTTGGAGLGLAIAKALVEAHHGQLSAESAGVPGLGTTFVVRLPLAQP